MTVSANYQTNTHTKTFSFNLMNRSRRNLQLLLQRNLNLVNLKQVHARATTLGLLYRDQALACKLFDSYGKLGNPQDACKLFDEISNPDIVSCTSLINLHLQCCQAEKAFSVFLRAVRGGLRPDSYAVVGALSACGKNKDLVNGKVVHGVVFQCALESVPIVGNALIDMYCRNGEVEDARLVFKEMGLKDVASWTTLLNGFVLCDDLESARVVFSAMPLRNDVAWTAMITGYAKGKMPVLALEVFKQMKEDAGSLITALTVVAVLSCCTAIGDLSHGQAIHGFAVKAGLDKSTYVGNTLMDLYTKGGCPELTVKVFHGLNQKDVFSWSTIISGYAFHGNGRQALEAFEAMLASGVIPNDISILAALSACSHGGLVVEGQRLFSEMIRCYGFQPKIEHYGCMVDLLGRSGLLQEARELIESMPIEPDIIVWRSLLGACLVRGNLELAELAGKKIIELRPDDDGAYVLLWNAYFSANRKEDARLIRKMMADRKIKKKPAWSSIKVNGVVHEFVAEGSSHHASAEMYSLLRRITSHLKLDPDDCYLESE